ncbi:TetR-like C-terminal domain-containing protein [Streptomyces albogriseolus]
MVVEGGRAARGVPGSGQPGRRGRRADAARHPGHRRPRRRPQERPARHRRRTARHRLRGALPRPGRRGRRQRDLGRRFVAQLLEPQLQLYVDRLRAAQDAGDVRPDVDPRIALELFVSPLAQRWLQYTGPITYEYTDTLVDYALHGLAPR